MKDISMHIMDIARNSIRAEAKLIEISIAIKTFDNTLEFKIKDDGFGMDEETVKKVTDPFVSSRTTRKVGLGLPFLKMNAEQTGGTIHIVSTPGEGTEVKAVFFREHVDCVPLGDVAGALALLISGTPEVDFLIRIRSDENMFALNSMEVKAELEEIGIWNPEVVKFLKDMIEENMQELNVK